VAWYGKLAGERTPLQPRYPIDLACDLQCPVLGLYGGKDTGIPLDSVEQTRDALSAARKRAEIVVYFDAAHGFHAGYRPAYDRAAAEDGWRRLLAWFTENGTA